MFAEVYIRSQLTNQEKEAEIQNMGFEALIRQGIAAGQCKSGFRPKTRGFFNKFRGCAHVDSYVPDYDNRNGKRECT
jgi:hypothetical protein